MPQHRKRKRERETDVMEDRSTTTSVTTALQGGNENHGNDSENQVMAIGPTTTSVTSTLQGGIQVGNNNKMINRNCAITYNITNITVNCTQCHPAEDHVVSEDTPRDLIPSSSVHMTTRVRLVDCKGRELELGDVVVQSKGDLIVAIYAGDGMIIGVNKETGKIVHESINVEEPFSSYSPTLWIGMYNRIQIVQRAKGKVGQKYDNGQCAFWAWCYAEMTMEESTAQMILNIMLPRRVNAKYRPLASSIPDH